MDNCENAEPVALVEPDMQVIQATDEDDYAFHE